MELVHNLLSTVLFVCYDDVHPMQFVLLLKHTNPDEIQQLVELMQICGAKVDFKLKDVDMRYAIIIVDHKEPVPSNCPVFGIEYIHKCLTSRRIVDIASYRREDNRDIAMGFSAMDVVYFRKFSWDEIMQRSTNNNTSQPQCAGKRLKPAAKEPEVLVTSDDDSSPTLTYIDSNSYKALSQRDSVSDSSSPPAAQSLHHSDKRLKKKLEETDALETNSEELKLYHTRHSNRLKQTVREPDVLERNRNGQQNHPPSCTRRPLNNCESNRSDKPPGEDTPQLGSEASYLEDFERYSDDEQTWSSRARPPKRSRNKYSIKECCAILQYIVQHDEYTRVKGKDLWIVMERRKVCPQRTWQSMKEHFRKKIIFDLDSYEFLTKEQKKTLRKWALG